VWSPDDRYVAYRRVRDIFRKPVAGGSEERIAQSPASAMLTDWTPDGRYLVLSGFDPVTKDDVYVAPLNPPGPVRKIIGSNFSEAHARVSPDGRWIAFTSDETGAMEVYVQRFDPSGAPQQKIQISRDGGTIPHWTRDGRSVIYQESLQFSKVDLTFQPNLTASEPKKLFEQTYYGFFDVASDGKLLVAEAPGIPNEPISVVVNWPALLKP
jgi:eukaryotic-like serine/threonine-protein kinase